MAQETPLEVFNRVMQENNLVVVTRPIESHKTDNGGLIIDPAVVTVDFIIKPEIVGEEKKDVTPAKESN